MLSVIIPVYKTESTLDRCVESVLQQQVDLEVLLIDDGSPDRCPAMCDSWEQKDPRVRVIHRPNGGLSAARNTGIGTAHGEWVTFVDSDDYLSPETYAPLMAQLSEHPDYDIIEYGLIRFEGSSMEEELVFADEVYTDMTDYWLRGRAYDHSYAWNKVYARWLFDHVRFPEGKVFEDVRTLPALLRKAKKVATVTMGCYHYCLNKHGITRTAGPNETGLLFHAHLDVLNHLLRVGGPRLDADLELSRYYIAVMNTEITYMLLSNDRSEMPPYRFRIPADLPMRTRWKMAFIRFFGVNALVRILRLL